MAKSTAWFLFLLGIGHIAVGLVQYRKPLRDAVVAGFVGKFAVPEIRRTAFWFLVVGPLMMLAGQVGLHAIAQGDRALLRMLGMYVLVSAVLGAAAFPKSPFWAALVASLVLIAAGYGWLALD